LASEALGVEYAEAKQRCDEVLNPHFDAWRGRDTLPEHDASRTGTFRWMVGIYKTSPRYLGLPAKTRKSYDAMLKLVSDFPLKDGRTFGELLVASINGGVADRLFSKLKPKPDGSERTRTAVLAMRVCQRAWGVARRDRPADIPADNPFAKMGLSYRPKQTRPFSYDELVRFVRAADATGETSIGTAAMIAYFWLQRETDIISRLNWNQYRPADAPDVARVFHHKTGAVVDVPLYDDDGTALWPELMQRLDASPRNGTLIVMRNRPDRRRKVLLPWREDYFRHRVADIRLAAGIDREAKFMGLRHGGNTEGADAELSDAQLRALSGHQTAAMVQLYAKATMKQRRAGARKRLDARTKRGGLSE
jgi:hypothetical protein